MFATHFITREQIEQSALASDPSSILTTAELSQFRNIGTSQRRHNWLAGRVVAKRLLSNVLKSRFLLDYAANEICIFNDVQGVPRAKVENRPSLLQHLSLSISHESGHAACAVSFVGLVGIDIACKKNIKPMVQRYYLSDAEMQEMRSFFPDTIGPTLYWTIKEAYLKAKGVGLTESPRNTIVRISDHNYCPVLVDRSNCKINAIVQYKIMDDMILSTVQLPA